MPFADGGSAFGVIFVPSSETIWTKNRKEYLMQASPFEALFARLAQSDFRSRFRLGSEEVACIGTPGNGGHPPSCRRFRASAARAGVYSQRRQADAHAGASGLSCAARYGDMLPGLHRKMA